MEFTRQINIETADLIRELADLNENVDIQELLKFSRKLSNNKRFEQSEICNNLIISKSPNFPPVYILQASNILNSGYHEKAITFVERSLSEISFNESQLVLMNLIQAKAFLAVDLIEKAEALVFTDYKEYENKALWINLLEIEILEKNGDTSKLIELLKTKIDYYEDNNPYRKKLIETLLKSGQLSEAYNISIKYLNADPGNTEYLFFKGKIEFDKLEFEKAKSSFKNIVSREDHYKAHLWLGWIYSIENQKELEREHLNQAIMLCKEVYQKIQCLNILIEIGDAKTIDNLIDSITRDDLTNPDTLVSIGQIKFRQLKFVEAESYYNKALKLKEEPAYYFELGKLASEKKEYDRAEEIFISNDLLNHPRLKYFTWKEYCRVAKRRGRNIEALQRYREFESMYPQDFEIKKEITGLLLKLSKYNEAVVYLKEELDSNPDNIKAYRSLIDCYYQNQDYFKALSTIDLYFKRFEKDEKVLYYQSECLRMVGKFDECEKTVLQALEIFPNSFFLKLSHARLYRRLSAEFFFEKTRYNIKSLEIHRSTKTIHAYQKKVLCVEIINDYIHLNQYSEALKAIEEYLNDFPGHMHLLNLKVQVYSKMGNHNTALEYIAGLPQYAQDDPHMLALKASELLYLDKWKECETVLDRLFEEPFFVQAYILRLKLLMRKGDFKNARSILNELVELSPHEAFMHNEIIDFALTDSNNYLKTSNLLGIKYVFDNPGITKLTPSNVYQEEDFQYIRFRGVVTISHIIVKAQIPHWKNISFSQKENDWQTIETHVQDIKPIKSGSILSSTISLNVLKIPETLIDSIEFYTLYPVSTDNSIINDYQKSLAEYEFTMNIVDTGLGDQLHYIRTAALLGESLGMTFKGFLKSELDRTRDRVTEDPRLYDDIGFRAFEIDDKEYNIVPVHLTLLTRFVPALHQWSTFKLFLKYVKRAVNDALGSAEMNEYEKPLVFFSIDDHNITRLIARLYYPHYEPQTHLIHALRKSFLHQRQFRNTEQSNKLQVLLQCRLGDVANIPLNYNNEDVWVIPFSGEVMKQNVSNKYHMRYSNLEKIKDLGSYLKKKFGDNIDLKLITDGYDYGIEYLKEYQQHLMKEMWVSNDHLDELKDKLHKDFNKEFGFVDEIVYGEEYDQLIRSIDLVTSSKVIISTNGQFTNEFKMSFAKPEEEYLIVKKLYSNLRVAKSPFTKEMFWEIDGIDLDKLKNQISEYIIARL